MALQPESDVDVLVGVGGTAGGRDRRLRGPVPRRRDLRPARAARRGGEVQGAQLGLQPGPGADHRRPGARQQRLLRGHRHHRRGGPPRRRHAPDLAITQTLSMRSRSGAVRTIETKHRLSTSTPVPAAATGIGRRDRRRTRGGPGSGRPRRHRRPAVSRSWLLYGLVDKQAAATRTAAGRGTPSTSASHGGGSCA